MVERSTGHGETVFLARPSRLDGDYSPHDGDSACNRAPSPATNTAETDYDQLPYPSMPITYTQPAHLAALATLFGLVPPSPQTARILEFGCAAGGNIIPLAARFPTAEFLGIDLSHRHVTDGQRRIATLGLSNIQLLQGDLTTLDLGHMQFDYIICHGVFSWVPKTAQDAVFRLCQQVLAPNGIATISYNVLPGWHLRTAIRELCLRYAGTTGSARDRVSRARMALQEIAEASNPADPYGMLLQTEARRLKGVPNAYILGEFLAPDNAPCYVRDFIARAAAENLDYLCEADLFGAVPQTLPPALRGRLTTAGAEQDIDFLTGRLFRRSILVRSQSPDAAPRSPDPDRLNALHLSLALRHDPMASTQASKVFADGQGRSVTISDPVVAQAITRLAAVYPATLPIDELAIGQSADRIRRAIFEMTMAGRISLSVLPLHIGQGDQRAPEAWPFARVEAASHQAWLTTLRHTGVPALPILKLLVPLIDGTRDRMALRPPVVAALASGALAMPDRTGKPEAAPEAIADEYIEQAMRYLTQEALLCPIGSLPAQFTGMCPSVTEKF